MALAMSHARSQDLLTRVFDGDRPGWLGLRQTVDRTGMRLMEWKQNALERSPNLLQEILVTFIGDWRPSFSMY